MLTVTMCKGLPASGKTTWAKQQVETYPGRYKRVNKDDLRAMLDCSKHSKSNEKFVLELRDTIIRNALRDGKHVIVDDTNFATFHEDNIRKIAKEHGAQVVINDSFLETSLEECIKRDANRDKAVGEKVIRDMYNKYLFRSHTVVPHNPNLPSVIICDLDGTLCLLNGRNPYDASTCDQDLINIPVYKTLVSFYERGYVNKIIFVSGRKDEYVEPTVTFLHTHFHNTFSYTLHMRKTDDNRKDCIVKKEIYDTYLKDKYNILFVMDDRNQVVNMWREQGLTCFQVAEGNF